MMIEIFEYDFMRKAFLVGILLAVIIPCIGMIVVFKRLSLMGDAMSHSSLAGVALGLILGFNPVLGAMGACLLAAFSIEAIRKKIPRFSELSIAIVLSVGVGLAGVLSGFVKKAVDFNRFLFGSIVSISDFDLALVICIAISVFLAFLLLYKELFYISFDEQAAALSGVPVRLVNTIFTVLTALTVSIAAQTVGALIVSSLMVVPVATGMILARSYRQTAIWSVLCAVTAMLIGLTISYYAELKPGGTIVLTGVVLFLLALFAQKILSMLRTRKMKGAAHES